MSQSEFNDWIAYSNFEPWGERREDLRMAMQDLLIARITGNKKLQIEDFLISNKSRARPKDVQEANKTNIAALAAIFGGKVEK